MMSQRSIDVKQGIIDFFRERLPDTQALYVYGSVGTDHERLGSDVDLAILPAHPLAKPSLQRFRSDLEILLRRDVDLIDLLQANTVLRYEIIRTGTCIYHDDLVKRQLFEIYAFLSYFRFNEERKEIVMDIKKRGSIYA